MPKGVSDSVGVQTPVNKVKPPVDATDFYRANLDKNRRKFDG